MIVRAAAPASAADPNRIDCFIARIAEVGIDPGGGWSRLAYSPEERAAHDVFRSWMERDGFTTFTDAVGNTIAELAGTDGKAALVVGSHLDTVPNGGNYDGVAGVAAAAEAARLVAEAGGLRRALRVVVFAAEEGARFGTPCIGSRVATGLFTAETLDELRDGHGRSVAECAAAVGLRPVDAKDAVWQAGSVAAFFELHIEQGRVLETRGRPLGVVHTVAGSTRLEITLSGQRDHSGATPMRLRQDALAGASELVLEVERLAAAHPTTVGTVGRLTIDSGFGSLTTVPGRVTLGVDVRDVDPDRQRDLAEATIEESRRIAARRGLTVMARLLSDQSPVCLHTPVQDALVRAARSLEIPFAMMASGASHDAAHVARIAPTGMLFVPCRGGMSHVPDEWADIADIAHGASVLTAVLQILDRETPSDQQGCYSGSGSST